MSNYMPIKIIKIAIVAACISLISCGYVTNHFDSERFASSGSVVVSLPVPSATAEVYVNNFSSDETTMSPLLGYLPPVSSYLPTENEVWIQVDREAMKVAVFKGKAMIKEIAAEGLVALNSGDYFVKLKQKDPIWYAPDSYFAERELVVPSAEDKVRYRRGALGKYAIYPTDNFAIHSAPIWSKDVGGIRVSSADLASIYYLVPLGTPVVVK